MSSQTLRGKKVALLVADGFEQVELTEPKKALENAGATAVVISPVAGQVQGMHHDKHGDKIPVDVELNQAQPADYDGLILPGGVMNPDTLRVNSDAVSFVKAFIEAGKPVAAICHGPWTLIEAGVTKNRTMTSWPSLRTDLQNAGANWVDQEVVVDRGLVTSRNPDDLPAFNAKVIEEFAEGNHGSGLSGHAASEATGR